MDLLYGIRILAVDYFVVTIHVFDRQTDRQRNRQTDKQTDRKAAARPRVCIHRCTVKTDGLGFMGP